jgi:hypothetical protein
VRGEARADGSTSAGWKLIMVREWLLHPLVMRRIRREHRPGAVIPVPPHTFGALDVLDVPAVIPSQPASRPADYDG